MKSYKSITLNEKTYPAKEIDFNMVCDLQEMGINIAEAKKVPTAFVRAYIALCMDADKDIAGIEIQDHMKKGGDLGAITEVILKKFETSDFFRTISKSKSEETTED